MFAATILMDVVHFEFLPGDAESVAALRAARRFESGDVSPAVVVIARDGGLTAEDREVLSDLRSLDLPLASPQAPEPTFSDNRQAGLLALPL